VAEGLSPGIEEMPARALADLARIRGDTPMFEMLLLAGLAATPAPSPVPAPPTPAVGTATGSVPAAPKSLTDVARERKLGKKGVEGGTLSVAGSSVSPAVTTGGKPPRAPSPASQAKTRVRAAEAEVRAARRALDETALRTGMTSEDAALKRARLMQAQKELAEAKDAAALLKR